MSEELVGLTRGGATWTPEFVTELNAETCIGCGRCYKVCPRDVFELTHKEYEYDDMDDDDDFDDDDDGLKMMVIKDVMDCIGCKSCSKVCPKDCLSHETLAA